MKTSKTTSLCEHFGLLRDLPPDILKQLIELYGGEDNIPLAALDPVGAADAIKASEILKGGGTIQEAAAVAGSRPGFALIPGRKQTIQDIISKLIQDQQEIKDFVKMTHNVWQDGLTLGFNLGLDQTGGQAITEAMLLDFPAARRVLKKIEFNAATKSLKTTKKDLARIIAANIKEGGSAADLAADVSQKFELQYLGNRSFVIARTEGTGVLNAGTFVQMEEDGTGKKKWRATLDGRQRPAHEDVHIETQKNPIPASQPFHVGDSYGQYPGDQSLHIKERARCRCALVNADLDALRCRHYDALFTREHGSYERRLQQAVNVYFKRMQARILSRLPKQLP